MLFRLAAIRTIERLKLTTGLASGYDFVLISFDALIIMSNELSLKNVFALYKKSMSVMPFALIISLISSKKYLGSMTIISL